MFRVKIINHWSDHLFDYSNSVVHNLLHSNPHQQLQIIIYHLQLNLVAYNFDFIINVDKKEEGP